MKPLQSVGLGLVVIALHAGFGEYDGLPDPLGWLLVLLGLHWLTRRTPIGFRMTLWYLGVLALVVSCARWFPSVQDAVLDADHAVVWAADVPALAFLALLCHALADLAAAAKDRAPLGWLRLCEAGLIVGIVAPVLYYAAGWTWLSVVGELGAVLQLAVIVFTLLYAGRDWAGPTQGPARRKAPTAGPEGDRPSQ